eukprot:2263722-Prymnesium_polylepis.1
MPRSKFASALALRWHGRVVAACAMPWCGPLCRRSPPPPAEPADAEDLASLVTVTALLLGAAVCLYLAGRPGKQLSERTGCALALAVNVVSVSLPGRFDSDVDPGHMSFPWPTLFSPAGFAFAIWAAIYLGEFAGVGLVLLGRDDASLQGAASASNNGWLAACGAQALWCAAFRPWALSRLWLSTCLLAATACCLYASQQALYSQLAQEPTSSVRFRILGWPRSLHLGW